VVCADAVSAVLAAMAAPAARIAAVFNSFILSSQTLKRFCCGRLAAPFFDYAGQNVMRGRPFPQQNFCFFENFEILMES
jgi:hypothetical protein